MDPRALIGALKDLIEKAKESEDPEVKLEALKTREAVRRLKEELKKEGRPPEVEK